MKRFAKVVAVVLVAVMTLTVLVACGYSSDPEKAVEQLKKQGYQQVQYYHLSSNQIEATIEAYKNDDSGYTLIIIEYYQNVYKAKSAYKDRKQYMDEMKEYCEEKGIKESVSRSGKQLILKRVYLNNNRQ